MKLEEIYGLETTDVIANSPFCVFCINEEVIQNARLYALWEYAKQLKKPFLVFLKKGVVIPEDMLNGIDLIDIHEWHDEIDLAKYIKENVKVH